VLPVPVAMAHGSVLLALVPVPPVLEVVVELVVVLVLGVLELVLEPNNKASSCSSKDCRPASVEPLELPDPVLAVLVPELDELVPLEPCPAETELEPLELEPCPPPSQDQGHPRLGSPAPPKPPSPGPPEPSEPPPQGLPWTLTSATYAT
jgi:hypothetical protein